MLIDIDWNLAYSLCRVSVEENFALSAHLANLLGGLDDACRQCKVEHMMLAHIAGCSVYMCLHKVHNLQCGCMVLAVA